MRRRTMRGYTMTRLYVEFDDDAVTAALRGISEQLRDLRPQETPPRAWGRPTHEPVILIVADRSK